MTCPNGHELAVSSAYCPTCGTAVTAIAVPAVPAVPAIPDVPAVPAVPAVAVPAVPAAALVPTAVAAPALDAKRSLYTAAAIVNWVVFGLLVVSTLGIGVIAGAWFIPMTIRMHKDASDPYRHTALGVCTLLFCNLVSGILILVDDSGRPSRPAA